MLKRTSFKNSAEVDLQIITLYKCMLAAFMLDYSFKSLYLFLNYVIISSFVLVKKKALN